MVNYQISKAFRSAQNGSPNQHTSNKYRKDYRYIWISFLVFQVIIFQAVSPPKSFYIFSVPPLRYMSSQLYVINLKILILLDNELGYLSQYSAWLCTGQLGFNPKQGQRIFLLTSASRPALGSTQPPTQCIPAVFSPGTKRGQGVTLITHPRLLPRS
jgi:hypothetical protein